MKSREYKDREKKRKEKSTWGNVKPEPRSAEEQSVFGAAEANAEHKDSDNVSSSNMDPEPREGASPDSKETEGKKDWQQLSKKEQKRSDGRKGGYPKN
jgi:hypothetical protein